MMSNADLLDAWLSGDLHAVGSCSSVFRYDVADNVHMLVCRETGSVLATWSVPDLTVELIHRYYETERFLSGFVHDWISTQGVTWQWRPEAWKVRELPPGRVWASVPTERLRGIRDDVDGVVKTAVALDLATVPAVARTSKRRSRIAVLRSVVRPSGAGDALTREESRALANAIAHVVGFVPPPPPISRGARSAL